MRDAMPKVVNKPPVVIERTTIVFTNAKPRLMFVSGDGNHVECRSTVIVIEATAELGWHSA